MFATVRRVVRRTLKSCPARAALKCSNQPDWRPVAQAAALGSTLRRVNVASHGRISFAQCAPSLTYLLKPFQVTM